MLGYLDALISALSLRDAPEAARLLRHPLAQLLPAEVTEEAEAISAGARDTLAVPLRAMQLRRQTAELLQEAPALADAPATVGDGEMGAPQEGARTLAPSATVRRRRPQQMELSLSA
jgi:hypothetical protein